MKASIIVPVFNDLKAIKLTLQSLEKQKYQHSNFEIIVIDNGSSDGSFEYLETVNSIILLKETEHLGSPYSCRNRGIEIAKSDIIVFLDSTCVPKDDFLEKGIEFIENNDCDMFGGNVVFDFENRVTGAKIFDSISNIQMRHSIETKGAAKTANLWVKRNVIDKVGMFIEGERSGDDVGFTSRSKEAGYNLVFCEQCMAYKFARGFKELVKKQFRVGMGMSKRLKSEGNLLISAAKLLLPIPPNTFKTLLDRNKYITYTKGLILRTYMSSIVCRLATFNGIVVGSLKARKD